MELQEVDAGREARARAIGRRKLTRLVPGSAGPSTSVRTRRPDKSYRPSDILSPALTPPGIESSTAPNPFDGLGHGAERASPRAKGASPASTARSSAEPPAMW